MKRTRRERRSRPNALYIAPFTFNLALLPFPTLSPRAPMFRVPFGANLLGVLPFYGTTREGENRLRFASSLEPLGQGKDPRSVWIPYKANRKNGAGTRDICVRQIHSR